MRTGIMQLIICGVDTEGNRHTRYNAFAPVDIKCIFVNTTECMAVWESLEEVHLANRTNSGI